MIPIGCNCGKRQRQVQVIDTEQAQSIVDQQVVVAALGSMDTIVDPDERVPEIR